MYSIGIGKNYSSNIVLERVLGIESTLTKEKNQMGKKAGEKWREREKGKHRSNREEKQ